MFEVFIDANYLAVIVAEIVGMVLGMLWYGPVFGKKWIALMGWTDEQMARMKEQGMAKAYILNFITTLVMTWVLAGFVSLAGAGTFAEGSVVGFWLWLGFVAMIMYGSVLWEGRKTQLYFLNISFWLVNFLILGGILAVWQ